MPEIYNIRGVSIRGDYPLLTPKVVADLKEGSYECAQLDILQETLDSDDNVMEVGAGLGVIAVYCARQVGSASVHTWEANPELAAVLHDTFQLNHVRPQAHIEGLWVHDGTALLHKKLDFWSSSLLDIPNSVERTPVRCRKFRAALTEVGPTYIVCNAEGAESHILISSDLAGVRKICVEFHPRKTSNEMLTELLSHLIARGFVCDLLISTCRNGMWNCYFYRKGVNTQDNDA